MATGRLPDPNTAPLTAKGDLYTYSTVPARLAVGSNGDTLVADSSATTGLRWQPVGGARNALINGAMDYWQRGTSFSAAGFNADRWQYSGGFGTGSISRVTVAGVSGIPSDIQYALRYNFTVAGTGYFRQLIEGAGFGNNQTLVLSFYARNNGASALTFGFEAQQYFGTGGSPSATVTSFSIDSVTIPTGSSFNRYQMRITLPTTAGKTFGTNNDSALILRWYDLGAVNIDFTGFQLEVGSIATPFVRAGGTLAGELAACQRYYYRQSATNVYSAFGFAWNRSSTQGQAVIQLPVRMRVAPTAVDSALLSSTVLGVSEVTLSSITINTNGNGNTATTIDYSGTSLQSGFVTITGKNDATAYLGFSAEL